MPQEVCHRDASELRISGGRAPIGQVSFSFETYVKVDGRWYYLYRVIDADGNRVDSMPSEMRDRDAAKRFFARARTVVGDAPEKVTTDGHGAYPRAIRATTRA